MLKLIRLPLINTKNLVTDIKFSGFFESESIFEAIQFKVAKEVLDKKLIEKSPNFQCRTVRLDLSKKNPDLEITKQAN